MTSGEIKREIERLTYEFLAHGLALTNNGVAVYTQKRRSVITWRSDVGDFAFKSEVFASISEYCNLLANRQYSFVLFDGSLIQISYVLERTDVIKHRLCYYPCPIVINNEDLVDFGLLDLIELIDYEEFRIRLRLQSPIRFDLDLDSVAGDHPASHLHLSREDCRVPVCAPLSIGQFIGFVFRHFYPDQWGRHEFIRKWASPRFARCLHED